MNEKQIELVTKTAAETAVKAAMAYVEQDRKLQQVTKRDRRLRNTRLLLKHYRDFVRHCEELEDKLSAYEEAKTLSELHDQDYAVEAIKKSQQRTIVMVRFIKRSLEAYRTLCERSRQAEDMRRYRIIETMYISDEKQTTEEIAEFHKIDVRTVYKDINNACKTLSVLVFGVDAIHLD